jgi:hypothetical protein
MKAMHGLDMAFIRSSSEARVFSESSAHCGCNFTTIPAAISRWTIDERSARLFAAATKSSAQSRLGVATGVAHRPMEWAQPAPSPARLIGQHEDLGCGACEWRPASPAGPSARDGPGAEGRDGELYSAWATSQIVVSSAWTEAREAEHDARASPVASVSTPRGA